MDFVKLPKRKKFPRNTLEGYRTALLHAEAEYRKLLRKEVPQNAINAQGSKPRGVPKGLEQLDAGAREIEVIGIKHYAAQLMRKEWETYDGLIDAYENYKWRLPGGVVQTGPERWHEDKYKEAIEAVCYEFSSDLIAAEYTKQIASYEDYYLQCIKNMQPVFHSAWNKFTGMTYLWQQDPQVKEIYMAILVEFRDWLYAHPVDKVFLLLLASKEATLGAFFRDRPDMAAALRLAQTMPQDMEKHQGDPYVSDGVRFAVELAVSLIPVVGNAVALWEAYEGHDLFDFPLSDTERAILAAAVFLPLAGRLAKNGVRAYTAARAYAIFGKDLQAWEKSVEWAAKANENHIALKIIQEAEEEYMRTARLNIEMMKQVAGELSRVSTFAERGAKAISPELEKEIVEGWAKLTAKYPVLKLLDLPAIRRVLGAGYSKTTISIDNMRGHIAEELIEHWLLPLLRSRAGAAALGIKKLGINKKLVYYPSHIIQSLDSSGQDLVDGLLGYWEKGDFHVLAIFEAKSGTTSAEKMIMRRIKPEELPELMKTAELRWIARKGEAKMSGQQFTTTLEDFQKQFLLDEQRNGSQVKRILERLSVNDPTKSAELFIGGRKATIRVPQGEKVKFYALVPNDLPATLVEQITNEMAYHGFDMELKSVPMKMSELKEAAEGMKDIAKKVMDATAPPLPPPPPPKVKK